MFTSQLHQKCCLQPTFQIKSAKRSRPFLSTLRALEGELRNKLSECSDFWSVFGSTHIACPIVFSFVELKKIANPKTRSSSEIHSNERSFCSFGF